MPEGPELRRSADHLSKLLVGKRLHSLGVNRAHGCGGRYASKDPTGLQALCEHMCVGNELLVEGISCKGKFMWWSFSSGWTMWCTYGMSGQWTTARPDKHTAFTVWTDNANDGQGLLAIHFRDPRHFGTLRFMHERDGELTRRKLATLGPDMLSDPPDTVGFIKRMSKRSTRTLAEALMDQSVVSGVGNYVKAEALYLAELSPHRRVDSLTLVEGERLRQQIVNVMKASYSNGGATVRSYRNVDGTDGLAQRRFVVYGNRIDPMGNEVVKELTKDGRTTHWVPAIQR